MCCGHICRVTGKKNVQSCVLHLSRLTLQKKISQNTKQEFIFVTTAKVMLHKIFAWHIISVPSLH